MVTLIIRYLPVKILYYISISLFIIGKIYYFGHPFLSFSHRNEEAVKIIDRNV